MACVALFTTVAAPLFPQAADERKLEVFSWWTSGGEAAALDVLFKVYKALGKGHLFELVHGISEIDRGLSGDDVGDALLPEHGQVVLWDLFTHHTDKVIAIEITVWPSSRPQTRACDK